MIGAAGAASLVLALAAGAWAGAAAKHRPAAKDSFAGQISEATGSFSGDTGKLHLILRPVPGEDTRQLTLYLVGHACDERPRCLRLHGKLKGTMTEIPTGPDRGRSFRIVAAGHVRPAGQVSARGHVTGTGFTVYGRERLRLKLTSASSELTVTASSKRVSGFTSP